MGRARAGNAEDGTGRDGAARARTGRSGRSETAGEARDRIGPSRERQENPPGRHRRAAPSPKRTGHLTAPPTAPPIGHPTAPPIGPPTGWPAALLLGALLAGTLPFAAQAQQLSQQPPEAGAPPGQPVSAVLVIDRERLFRDSQYGQRLAAIVEAERSRQQAETRRIEEELRAEELALTEERASLSPEAFRARADAFDAKVEELRQGRDQAEQALLAEIERIQAEFLRQVSPVLAALLRERGALLMLDRRIVLIAMGGVDVTDMAIARIDARFGAPQEGGASPPAPGSDPEN